MSPTGSIAPKWVTQHALGLWTSEVAFYALDALYEYDLDTAQKRIRYHISVLDAAKNDVASKTLVNDDIITLKKLLSLAQNLGKVSRVSDNPQQTSA